MATQNQITANRENAKRSTGPRTAEGKSRSAQNSTKHGLLSHSTLLSIENPDELEKFRVAYYDKFQPVDDTEQILVDLMVDAIWRIDRLHYVDVEIFEKAAKETKAQKSSLEVLSQYTDSRATEIRSRLESRFLRNFTKARAELMRHRKEVLQLSILAIRADAVANSVRTNPIPHTPAPAPISPGKPFLTVHPRVDARPTYPHTGPVETLSPLSTGPTPSQCPPTLHYRAQSATHGHPPTKL